MFNNMKILDELRKFLDFLEAKVPEMGSLMDFGVKYCFWLFSTGLFLVFPLKILI